MRTAARPVGDILFGQTRSRVLALLFGTPEKTFFARQIARETETSAGTVQRELKTLSEVGLIERAVTGKQVFYQANRKHPAFAELRALIAKTSGVFRALRSALAPLAGSVSVAFVYGSMARGDEDSASDVDLMTIGTVTLDDLLAHLTQVEHAIGRPINPTVYSPKEFRSGLQRKNHFLNSVVRGKKVFLIGDEDELGKVG
ncbi:MAG TPA: nucleotidyltransferase domain-containing protein [Acidobacteriaceae bacterium]|jgi:predicted nucleotidyltransferase